MTREEAIDILKCDISADRQGIEYCHDEVGIEALDMAIKALEQEPCDKCVYSTKDGYCQYDDITETIPPFEPSGDLISKTEVRKFVEYIQSIKDNHNENLTPINYGTICEIVIEGWNLLKLPSVNPQEPKIGHWIADVFVDECSVCGEQTLFFEDQQKNYCPNCGAKMIEQKESEDKE